MNKPIISLRRLIIQGVCLGNLFALIASFLFAVIDGITIQVNGMRLGITESFNLDYSFLARTFGIGFALSILPASVGGAILAIFVNNNQEESLSQRNASAFGLLLGGFSGFAVCMLVGLLYFIIAWYSGKGSLTPFLIRSAEVTVLSSLAGGFTGLKVASYCKWNSSFRAMSNSQESSAK